MSQTIDNRVVEMQFDNKDFEKNVQQSLSTLDKLKQALKLDDAAKNLQDLSKVSKQVDLSTIADGIESLQEKLSTFRLLGIHALSNIVDVAMQAGKKIFSALNAPIAQAKAGGWARAANLENAKFQMQGILGSAEKVAIAMDSVDKAVTGTAYSLDEAAKIAAQLTASGVKLGDTLTESLKSIAGVAAQTNSSFADIGQIFATVKGQGKLMTMQLRQLEARGLNAAATLAEYLGTSEANVRDMVTKGKVSFEDFSNAMSKAFGENAAKANETFDGALSNMKSALNRIGAEFAIPLRQYMIPVLNQTRLFINAIKSSLSGVFDFSSKVMKILSRIFTGKLEKATKSLTNNFTGMEHIGNALKITFVNLSRILGAISSAFKAVFPSKGGVIQSANSLAEGIERLSLKLFVSDGALEKFRNGLTIVLRILRTVGSVVGKVFSTVAKAVGVVLKIVAGIAGFVVQLGRLITNLIKTNEHIKNIKKNGGLLHVVIEKLKTAFSALRNVLSDTSTVLGKVAQGIKTAVMVIVGVVGGALYLAFNKIKSLIETFKVVDPFTYMRVKIGETLLKIQELITRLKEIPVLGKAISALEKIFSTIATVIKKVGTVLKEIFTDIKNGEFSFTTLRERLSEIPNVFTELRDKIVNFVNGNEGIQTVLTKASDILGAVKTKLVDFVKVVRSALEGLTPGRVILITFATAIIALVLNINKMIESFTGALGAAKGVLDKFASLFEKPERKAANFVKCVTAIASAIAILTLCIKELAKIPTDKLQEVTKSLAILGGGLAGLALLSTIIGALTKVGGAAGFSAFSANMLLFSVGVAALVRSLILFNYINLDNIWLKVGVLGAIAGGLAVIAAILGKVAPTLTSGSLFMVAFAGSVYLLVLSLEKLTTIDLSSIAGYWKELLAIFVGLGIFARLAGGLGLGSLISLIGFIGALRSVFSNIDKLKETGASDKLVEIVEKLREGMVIVIERVKDIVARVKAYVSELTSSQEAFQNFAGMIIAIAGVILLVASALYLIGSVGKGLQRAAKAFVLFSACVAGLIYFSKYVGEWMAETPEMTKAIRYIGSFIVLMGIFELLVGKAGEDAAANIKAANKTFISMGLLMLAGAAFIKIVSDIPADGFDRALMAMQSMLLIVGGFVLLTAVVSNAGNGNSAGFGHFAGMVLMFGTMIGAMVGLLILLDELEDPWPFIAAIGTITLVMALMSKVFDSMAKLSRAGAKGVGPILAIFGGLAAIGVGLFFLSKNLKTEQIKPLIAASAIMIAVLLAVVGIAAQVQKMAKNTKYSITKTSLPALQQMRTTMAELVGILVAIGVTFKLLDGVDPAHMAIQALTITAVLGALFGLTILLAKVTKDIKVSDIKEGIAGLALIVGIFGVLSLIFLAINQLGDPKTVFLKSQVVGFVLLELLVLTQYISLVLDSFKDAEKGIFRLALMVGVFGLLSLIFLAINQLGDPLEVLKKSQTIMLVLLELSGIMALVGVITKIPGILLGEGALAIMVVLFGALAVVCAIIAQLPMDGLLAKTQTVMLVMLELEALMALCGVIGLLGPTILLGEAALLLMEALFAALAFVCVIIAQLPMDGLLQKTQVIVLVLLELEALAALCGVIGMLGPTILLGEASLLIMVALFGALSLVCAIIGQLQMEGLMEKTQTIVLVMLELEGLMAVLGVIAPLALIALPGMVGLVAICFAMIEIASALSMLQNADPGSLQGTIDILVGALWSLIGVGVGGIVGGPGLLLLAGGILALGNACIVAGNGFTTAAMGIQTLSMALPMLSTSIMMMGTSISMSLVQIGQSVQITISMVVNTIIIALQNLLTQAVPLVYQVSFGLGEGIVKGFKDGVGWHSPPEFVGNFFKDFLSAFKSGAQNVIGGIVQKMKDIGVNIIQGFRDGVGWHSPPIFTGEFWKDTIAGFKEGGVNAESVVGALAKGFGLNFDMNLASGLADGKGPIGDQINDILGMFNLLSSASELEAIAGKKSNINALRSDLRRQLAEGKISQDLYTASIQKSNLEMRSLKKQEEDLKNGTTNLTNGFAGLGDQVTDTSIDLDNYGSSAGSAKEKTDDLYDSMLQTIEGSMNIFDKFEEKDPMSADQMLENMHSQINGMSSWAADMNKLATMGIDQGLLQKLAELGPEGRDKVHAFATMTAEQMAEANTLWAQSLALPKQVTDMMMYDMKVAGANAALGLGDGIKSEADAAANEAKAMGDEVVRTVKEDSLEEQSPSKVMHQIGAYATEGLRKGMVSMQNLLFNQAEYIANRVVQIMTQGLNPEKFSSIGVGVVDGIITGVESKTSVLKTAITKLANAATAAAKSKPGFDVNSPSKKFIPIGENITEGLVVGINRSTGHLVGAIGDQASTALDGMRNIVSTISQMITDDMEDPVIRPVLDLSNVQAGARTLSSLFNNNQALSAQGSMNNLQNGKSVMGGVTFIQNNTSPKALTRTEIYRQTRNQLSQYRASMS